MSNDTLTITDNRTGKSYDVPVDYSTIKALDLRQIKVDPDEFGMMTYDPGFGNTAACKSAITYIDANWTGLDKMKAWADKLGNQAAA